MQEEWLIKNGDNVAYIHGIKIFLDKKGLSCPILMTTLEQVMLLDRTMFNRLLIEESETSL